MSAWKSIRDELPPVGCKFIATYNDASGAQLLFRHDAGYSDAEGNDWHKSELEDFSLWAALPEGFRFFCEDMEEPVSLTIG